MAATTPHPPHNAAVQSSNPTAALQIVQGAYYVLAGLAIAFGVETLQGPADRPVFGGNLWPVRAIAVVVVALGVLLVLSGRRGGGIVPVWTGMWAALILLVQTAAGLAMGYLSMTFLLDAALEALFLACWLVLGVSRADRGTGPSTPVPSG